MFNVYGFTLSFLLSILFINPLHCSNNSFSDLSSYSGSECGRKRNIDRSLEDLDLESEIKLHKKDYEELFGPLHLNNFGELEETSEELFEPFNWDLVEEAEEDSTKLIEVVERSRKRSAEDLFEDCWISSKNNKTFEVIQKTDNIDNFAIIEDLQVEVLLNIVTQIDQMSDLAAVACTSRFMNNVVSCLDYAPKNIAKLLSVIVAPGLNQQETLEIFIGDHNLRSLGGLSQFLKSYGKPTSELTELLKGAVDLNYICVREQLLKVDPRVTEIECIGLGLKIIPPQIFSFYHLSKLDLSGNKLKVIPGEIARLVNLEELTLINNELKTIPSEIGKLKLLNDLELGYNPIESFPDEVLNGRMIEHFHIEATPYSRKMTANFARNIIGL